MQISSSHIIAIRQQNNAKHISHVFNEIAKQVFHIIFFFKTNWNKKNLRNLLVAHARSTLNLNGFWKELKDIAMPLTPKNTGIWLGRIMLLYLFLRQKGSLSMTLQNFSDVRSSWFLSKPKGVLSSTLSAFVVFL